MSQEMVQEVAGKVPELTQEIKEKYDFTDQTLADIGRDYPLGFVCALAEEADEITHNWLKKIGAPEEVVAMHDYSIFFYRSLSSLNAGAISTMDARELTLVIPDFLVKALKFGDFQLYINPWFKFGEVPAETPKTI